MKYLGLDGKSYTLNTTRYLKKPNNKSKLHLQVREFLKKTFPCYTILEEVALKGCSKGTLYCDFMIVQLKTIVEAAGRQHSIYTPHFHPTKADFLRAKQRDNLKKQWCELNGFCLYEFEYNTNEDDWSRILNDN